jgi:hypothetical protein
LPSERTAILRRCADRRCARNDRSAHEHVSVSAMQLRPPAVATAAAMSEMTLRHATGETSCEALRVLRAMLPVAAACGWSRIS